MSVLKSPVTNGTHDPNRLARGLESLGLLDFLALDNRPTFVLEKNGAHSASLERAYIVYENPALQQLVTERPSFEEWASGIVADQAKQRTSVKSQHAGRTWTTTIIQDRWTIVCGTDAGQGQRQASVLDAGQGQGQGQAIVPNTGCRARREKGSPGPSAGSGNDSLSSADSDPTATRARHLDWTRYETTEPTEYQKYMKDYPWHKTRIGPMEAWDELLRAAFLHVMSNPHPRALVWGDDLLLLYNEACVPIFGVKHPIGLGNDFKMAWSEVWDQFSPLLQSVIREGKTIKLTGLNLMMNRHGFLEETYWDLCLLPICGPDGLGVGAIDEFTEVTRRVREERRAGTVEDVSNRILTAKDMPELWTGVLRGLERNDLDVPFALAYSVAQDDKTDEGTTGNKSSDSPFLCSLEASMGVSIDQGESVRRFAVSSPASNTRDLEDACRKAWHARSITILDHKDGTLPERLNIAIAGRGHDTVITQACIVPIPSMSSSEPMGLLVLGLNPCCPLSDDSITVINHLRDVIVKSATLIQLPDEQRKNREMFVELQSTLEKKIRASTLEARRAEARFTRMADTAPIGIYVYGPKNEPIYINEKCLQFTGLTREQFYHPDKTDFRWTDTVDERDKGAVKDAWQALYEHKPLAMEYRSSRPWQSVDEATGAKISSTTYLLAAAAPEVDDDGKITAVQGWVTDISQERFTQQLLAQRLDKANEAKRQSENFIDMTSHEMRNPLSAILQSADGILSSMDTAGMPILDEGTTLSTETTETIIDAAQTIILCAQHQKRIVDDILTLSKLDSNLLVISPDKTQPPLLLEKAVKMFEAELERAGIRTTIEIEPTYTNLKVDSVMIDASRILQVVINLVTNAIKFTQDSKKRKITLIIGASLSRPSGEHHNVHFVPQRTSRTQKDLSLEWGNGQDLYLQFAVKDTGKGMTGDEMKLLFSRFSQASPKTYKQYGGSGLGLFISRELTELQGGQIGVASEPGKGSTFTFYVKARRCVTATRAPLEPGTLPVPSTRMGARPVVVSGRASVNPSSGTNLESPSRMPQVRPAQNQLHVLIVEDNQINQKVMAKQVQAAGHVVHVANHGGEALEFIDKTRHWSDHAATESAIELSVILMDLEMPTMDGLTCVRKIRELQKEAKISSHIPVIAVTANARSEQIAIALNAGMDEVVTKPFRIPAVLEKAQSLLARLGQEKAGADKVPNENSGKVPSASGPTAEIPVAQRLSMRPRPDRLPSGTR